MEITKTVEQYFETDVTVDVDPEDVLDEMTTKDIEDYLDKRRKTCNIQSQTETRATSS